jgi:hypothetical protein
MTKKLINAYEVGSRLAKAVRDKGGDYVYKDEYSYCEYADSTNGEPRCIVGHALIGLGVAFDSPNTGVINGIIASYSVLKDLYQANPEIRLTNHAIVMLSAAQSVQDTGGTWEAAQSAASGALVAVALTSYEEEYVL